MVLMALVKRVYIYDQWNAIFSTQCGLGILWNGWSNININFSVLLATMTYNQVQSLRIWISFIILSHRSQYILTESQA